MWLITYPSYIFIKSQLQFMHYSTNKNAGCVHKSERVRKKCFLYSAKWGNEFDIMSHNLVS